MESSKESIYQDLEQFNWSALPTLSTHSDNQSFSKPKVCFVHTSFKSFSVEDILIRSFFYSIGIELGTPRNLQRSHTASTTCARAQ